MAKTVLLILLLFSVATWAIVFNRLYFLRNAAGGNRKFREHYGKLKRIAEMEQLDKRLLHAPLARLGTACAAEYHRIAAEAKAAADKKELPFFLQIKFSIAAENVESTVAAIVPSFDRGVFLLAMVSSLSPFLGLLGTVWGIMNSFYEIGNQGSASLPVVAPGIAEALVATLAGLAVAIPALFFYNYFNHRAERIETELEEFKELLLARLKREILETVYAEKRGNA
jgi:biopolymer transport protein TolQ